MPLNCPGDVVCVPTICAAKKFTLNIVVTETHVVESLVEKQASIRLSEVIVNLWCIDVSNPADCCRTGLRIALELFG